MLLILTLKISTLLSLSVEKNVSAEKARRLVQENVFMRLITKLLFSINFLPKWMKVVTKVTSQIKFNSKDIYKEF